MTDQIMMCDDPDAAIRAAKWDATRQQEAVKRVKSEAAKRILERYPQYRQNNAALGMYTPEYVADMVAYIGAVRLASDAIEERIAIDPSLDPATQPEWS